MRIAANSFLETLYNTSYALEQNKSRALDTRISLESNIKSPIYYIHVHLFNKSNR